MPSDNKDTDQVIKFSAQVSKVTTMADGGLRVVLDLSEKDIETAKKMMEVKQVGAILQIAAIPVKEQIQVNSGWKV